MADFADEDLTGSTFTHVRLCDATIRDADLSGLRLVDCWLDRVRMQGVEIPDLRIDGEVRRLVVNGVDVAAYVEEELDRRDPERPLMRPTTPDGFRAAWDVVERRWGETVERARTLPPARWHESVDGEWSFIQTLRHLVFATDVWVLRAVLGDPAPWDPLSLPFDQMTPDPAIPWDRAARPDLDVVLALRSGRMAAVRRLVDAATDETLAARAELPPPWGGDHRHTVAECLAVVLNEEYQHRRYAERDLDVLLESSG